MAPRTPAHPDRAVQSVVDGRLDAQGDEQLLQQPAVQTEDEGRRLDVGEALSELVGVQGGIAGQPADDELTPFERILVKNLVLILIKDPDIQRAAGLDPQAAVGGERQGA